MELKLKFLKIKKILTLEFMNDKYLEDATIFEDDVRCICFHLPVPLRLDEEWYKEYKKLNFIGKEIEELMK